MPTGVLTPPATATRAPTSQTEVLNTTMVSNNATGLFANSASGGVSGGLTDFEAVFPTPRSTDGIESRGRCGMRARASGGSEVPTDALDPDPDQISAKSAA